MIFIFILLPLAILAQENARIIHLHDGDAIMRLEARIVDNAVQRVPSFAYNAEPDFKWRYANYLKKTEPQMITAERRTSQKTAGSHRNNHHGPPPYIPTPYFLPKFSAGMPLYEGYRMLLTDEQSARDRLIEKQSNIPNNSDSKIIRMLFNQDSPKMVKATENI
ncbi:unnamed protein product [Haemonchus placei]|uniref:DUF4858 domain-containing protein n=1 Tax=Haemonchus placei TaxID=6290 RepID=A0A0N4W0U9_HAEPC|nr:unnamed protein product [Haemonchus placei]